MSINFYKVRNGICLKPNAVPSSPENGDMYYDSTSNLFQFYQNGVWVGLGAGGSSSTPLWTKYTVPHTSLQAATTTNNITLFSLPANTMIHQVVIKHSIQFAGSGLSGYTISIGIASNLTKYTVPFNVFQATSDTARSITQACEIESFSGATDIKISAVSSNVNLNQSTSGSVDIWVMTSLLP